MKEEGRIEKGMRRNVTRRKYVWLLGRVLCNREKREVSNIFSV